MLRACTCALCTPFDTIHRPEATNADNGDGAKGKEGTGRQRCCMWRFINRHGSTPTRHVQAGVELIHLTGMGDRVRLGISFWPDRKLQVRNPPEMHCQYLVLIQSGLLFHRRITLSCSVRRNHGFLRFDNARPSSNAERDMVHVVLKLLAGI